MSDEKKKTATTQRRTDDEDVLRAGVSVEAEKEARAEAKEDLDNEAPLISEEDEEELEADLVKDLPENAVVANPAADLAANTISSEHHSPPFDDEFAGRGGSYVIDGETGERKRQYEAVYAKGGKVRGYRPVR